MTLFKRILAVCLFLVFGFFIYHLGQPKVPAISQSKITENKKNNPDAGKDFIFPEEFIWGAATSAYQTEGANGLSDWDKWQTKPNWEKERKGRQKINRAANFYEDYSQDFRLARELKIESIRISIEWARLEPQPGKFDRKEMAHYKTMIAYMKRLGLQPFINLNHFTVPQWFANLGGWENDLAPLSFAKYAAYVAENLQDQKIKYWMTFNEPTILIGHPYLSGDWPPNANWPKPKKYPYDPEAAVKVYRNLVKAHRAAYDVIHKISDERKFKPLVGISHFTRYVEPHNPDRLEDKIAAASIKLFDNHYFINAIETHLDYIGLNYYTRTIVRFSFWSSLFFSEFISFKEPDIYPEGLANLVREFLIYEKPIIITENGMSDQQKIGRKEFLKLHLAELHKAVSEADQKNVKILGYFYWALIDTWEWEEQNFGSKMGLIEVNFQTFERKVKPSSWIYRDIIESNGLTEEIWKK